MDHGKENGNYYLGFWVTGTFYEAEPLAQPSQSPWALIPQTSTVCAVLVKPWALGLRVG